MVPTINSRLRSMMRAMQEVVLPALDADNAIAQEQGKLVLGSLSLLIDQVDYAHTFEVIEARDLCALLTEIAAMVPTKTLPAAVVAAQTQLRQARALIEIATTPVNVLQQINHDLRAALTYVIEEVERVGASELAHTIALRVLDFSATQLARERSWVAGTGFDPPGTVPDIPTALSSAPVYAINR
jgi:hypothetical protein